MNARPRKSVIDVWRSSLLGGVSRVWASPIIPTRRSRTTSASRTEAAGCRMPRQRNATGYRRRLSHTATRTPKECRCSRTLRLPGPWSGFVLTVTSESHFLPSEADRMPHPPQTPRVEQYFLSPRTRSADTTGSLPLSAPP